jgi:hypothetical protein
MQRELPKLNRILKFTSDRRLPNSIYSVLCECLYLLPFYRKIINFCSKKTLGAPYVPFPYIDYTKCQLKRTDNVINICFILYCSLRKSSYTKFYIDSFTSNFKIEFLLSLLYANCKQLFQLVINSSITP